ncbi:NYN domain-containing protein [Fusibacter sp. JL298sf-3]
MKKIVLGIMAHVDAGKTTLSESMLYLTGQIKKLGRVDNQDAFLDTYALEKARGVTIFSKQALFDLGEKRVTLLDTPGHVDFSAEMERTLQVLDYAVLVVSATDGVQGHTKTLWQLLKRYGIPTFIFVNKMDQPGANREDVMRHLRLQLDERCMAFDTEPSAAFFEEVALTSEETMNTYLSAGALSKSALSKAIQKRTLFPCYFGSALKVEGVEAFLEGLDTYTVAPAYGTEFGAKIFKVTRDDQGMRLTHMKIVGGELAVKDVLKGHHWEEKVNQIRLYSGEKYSAVSHVEAGTVCAVTGPVTSRPGEGLGISKASEKPILEPVLSYRILLSDGDDPKVLLPKLKQLEEEEPTYRFVWVEKYGEILVQIMGEVQTEILQSIVLERFDTSIDFDAGHIVYKETIANTVEGVGHFEPLRHYAEVHLLLEPGERGSGLVFETRCSEDVLSKNWQRLVLSHLEERAHIGVLTGADITDMRIALVAGRGHNRHTEGGDFREATFRALRQGLKEAKNVLLEPYYDFQMTLQETLVGRAMSDIERMHGTCEVTQATGGSTTLTGSAPVATMRNYQRSFVAYTKGIGQLFMTPKGYAPCHNTEAVIEASGYDSERDTDNPTGSVFCTKGSSFTVPWDEVKAHMHLEAHLPPERPGALEDVEDIPRETQRESISLEEIDNILSRASYANQGRKEVWLKKRPKVTYSTSEGRPYRPNRHLKEIMLVDGYNVLFAWPELKAMAESHMEAAKGKLLDILSNYQGLRQCELIVVFDAYKVKGRREEMTDYHNIRVVYTAEAQTADQYIEKYAYQNKDKYRITVVTSDGLQQIIIRGAGSDLISARELLEIIEDASASAQAAYRQSETTVRTTLEDVLKTDDEK